MRLTVECEEEVSCSVEEEVQRPRNSNSSGGGRALDEKTPLLDPGKESINRRRIYVLFPVLHFFGGISTSVALPIIPPEAEEHGISPSVYGLLVGVYYLAVLLSSPFVGTQVNKIGAKNVVNGSNYITGLALVSFGLLQELSDPVVFVILAFALRIIHGVAFAAIITASMSVAVLEFADNSATIVSALQIAFVLGRIVGSVLGGVLYQVGGFDLPFTVTGAAHLLLCVATCIAFPGTERGLQSQPSFVGLLRESGVAVTLYQTITVCVCIGFVLSTLEPQVKQLGASYSVVGVLYVTDAIVGSIANGCWAYLARRQVSFKLMTGCAALGLAIAFALIGPAPFLPFHASLASVVLALVLLGASSGGQILIPFIESTQTIATNGFAKDISTFALLTGLWTSAKTLGLFVGSSVGGVLVDTLGYPWSTTVFVVLQAIAAATSFAHLCRTRAQRTEDEKRGLLECRKQSACRTTSM